ncbi:hypothetical protein AciX9_4606 (plasmid) [Granulicella tundricola MP5ACTX9]|uniref:Uncharacterized protein n=1 Tax=Granulicella tundricola (strain ATCC BAA-1859 / DSM 23138 / MP5ACTX9) TaxID=1198114 RepID=E8X7V2_GRATM|nr:hypothetical protein AciX9_4606 [Granulicella tundricola MP5ACTX9]
MFFSLLQRSIRLSAFFLLAVTVGEAQSKEAPLPPDVPAVECKPPAVVNFDGLRVFSGTAPVLMTFHCGDKGSEAAACHAEYLDPAKPDEYQGDLIAPGATQGRWTCAMVGGWSGWIPTDRLAPVPSTPAITTEQWLGTWVTGHAGVHNDRLVVTRSAEGHGKIHVEGRANYTNIAHNVHTGQVSGDAVAMGPFLHILDHGELPDCVLDLKYDLASKTFRAVDNQLCGGFNVTFDGTWHQAKSKN